MMRNVRIERSRNILAEERRYQPETPIMRAPARSASQGVGIQLTAVVTVAIGLLGIACAVAASDGVTLVAGNPLAENVIAKSGTAALDAYRTTSMAFGLMLTALGIRTASIASRSVARRRPLTSGSQAILAGLVAANLSLIAWWTGWLFA